MEPRLQRRVQRYGWDRAAAYYEDYWRNQLEPAQQKLLEMAELEPGEHALDTACGTGLVSFPAAEAVGPEGSLVATDISEKMVEAGSQEAARRGLSWATFQRGECEKLNFADSAFDAVLCSLGLMYVPDPLEALREAWRVLKPGGRAVASVWGARDRCGWAEIFPIVDARVESDVCPLFFRLGTLDVLERTFAETGFVAVESVHIDTLLHYSSAEEALGAAFAGGPVALAYSRFDDATREAAHAEYLASIETYRRGEAYAIPGEFVVTRGCKSGHQP